MNIDDKLLRECGYGWVSGDEGGDGYSKHVRRGNVTLLRITIVRSAVDSAQWLVSTHLQEEDHWVTFRVEARVGDYEELKTVESYFLRMFTLFGCKPIEGALGPLTRIALMDDA